VRRAVGAGEGANVTVEGAGFDADGEPLPLPRVVNLEGYRARVGRMGDDVRVHLACGSGPRPDCLNVDVSPGPQVDVVADVDRLPFPAGSLAELSSANLVDRFHPEHFGAAILPHWKALLRPGGVLRVVCPNWEEAAGRLRDGSLGAEEFLAAASQVWDRPGGAGVVMYTPHSLGELLRRQGFEGVEVIASARPTGPCPEMEIVARRPAEGAMLSAG
jgi:hypothetical protein